MPEVGGTVNVAAFKPAVYALPSATNGVAMNPPPVSLLPSISAAVADACKTIPPGKRGALVAVATQKGSDTNVNLAFVTKIGDDFAVTAWIGRSWDGNATGGKHEVGAQVAYSF